MRALPASLGTGSTGRKCRTAQSTRTAYPPVVAHLTRRRFLRRLGKGTLAIAVFGPIACSDSATTSSPAPATTAAATTAAATTVTTTAATTTTAAAPAATTSPPTAPAAPTWSRVNLGFVSAYILARSGRAAIVDTGVEGSEGQIEATLGEVGLGWGEVDHVILTHLHGDHVGSLGGVLANAPDAAGYAGEADIAGISSPRPLAAVGDGDEVFGLQIVETPGHTAGHISVLDPEGGVLVAGDALNTSTGQVAGSDPRFTADQAAADASVQKLAGLTYEVLFPGHGEPILAAADVAVLALADSI